MERVDKAQIKKLFIIVVLFLLFYYMPADLGRISTGLNEAVLMARDYAREHVLLCLVPAFFIAGAISVFVKSDSVMKYLGASAALIIAYSVGAISGAVLAVCSCTILPIFVGIYKRGAGLGPAITFLYAGPAINVVAITMTARILGFELGLARTITAIVLSVLIGLVMALIFRKEERVRMDSFVSVESDEEAVDLWRIVVIIGSMIGFLIFANFAHPGVESGILYTTYSIKWYLAIFFLIATILSSLLLFKKELIADWLSSTLEYTLMVTPFLFIGVLAAGFLLGRPGHEALIPSAWIEGLLGGNSLLTNFFASIAGAFMYFATLTEVPIIQGLMGAGMGKGPALALLLAGPALSLPSILVIARTIKWKKALAFLGLVVLFSTLAGYIFGLIV
ncbi:MAG TPA: permease [Thermoclostridium sp.]|nr:permease [Thermoclostridium sp.]